MAKGPRYAVKFLRRRAGATNYKKRIKILQSNLPRLIVRKSDKYVVVQVSEFTSKGDKILLVAHSSELKKLGWKFGTKSIPAAYLTGLLAAKKAKAKGVQQAVLDIGLHTATKGAKVFAALKGAIDGGLNVAHGSDMIPSEDRISGKHIAEYLKKPEITKEFEAVKGKIK